MNNCAKQCNTDDDCLELEEKNNGELVRMPDSFQGTSAFLSSVYNDCEGYINRIISAKTICKWSSPECLSGKNMAGRILNQATGVGTYETGH